MKTITLAALLLLAHINSFAQTCSPQIAMVDYGYHDDHSSNPHLATIQAVKPDILIDNTPHGYWGGQCLPPAYNAYGVHVYSYITGGYEGTKYRSDEDNNAANLARISGIKNDGAAGVFLDEVSSHPDAAGRAYISDMFEQAHASGLKIILNPGTPDFDTFLVSHSDYIVTDEQYDGRRKPTASELFDLSKMIVLNDSVPDADSAAKVTDGARNNGLGHSYACTKYIEIPSWINDYMSLINHPTPIPVITKQGSTLYSNAPYGNQWYGTSTGVIPGATAQDFTPGAQGSYYDIVTTAGCSSGPSDTINIGTLATVWMTPLSAVQSGLSIILHWQTTNDINAANYIIERSVNTRSFTSIGTQNKGDAGASTWTDLQPSPGWNYYRIKVQRANGTSIYSNIRAVNFSTAQTISIYPNPVTGYSFSVKLDALQQPLAYTLTDMQGKRVALGVVRQPAQKINTGALAKGYYLLQLASGEKTMLFISR